MCSSEVRFLQMKAREQTPPPPQGIERMLGELQSQPHEEGPGAHHSVTEAEDKLNPRSQSRCQRHH